MKVISVKDLEELGTRIDSDSESYDYEEEFIVETEDLGEDVIITYGKPYYLSSHGLLVIEGTYMCYVDGEHEPDFSLTLVYDWNGKQEFSDEDANKYVMFEQDSPTVTVHNYLHVLEACDRPAQPAAIAA